MSTLVIVRKGKKAVIASDSLFTQGSTRVLADNKINHHKIHAVGKCYIGFTGSTAIHSIWENIVEKYPGDLDFRSRKHIFNTFLFLHQKLKKDYFVETAEDTNQPVESSQWGCLIAAPSGIYMVQSYREVSEYQKYWADGSGTEYALGAIHASYDHMDEAEQIAVAGVQAACSLDKASALPVQAFSVDLD